MTLRKTLVFTLALLLVVVVAAPFLNAQSLTQGDVAGTVTDPSGAVVPGATVTLRNDNTGATQSRTTNNTGAYRFSLLQPGRYTLTVNAPNYQPASRGVVVAVGQASTLNMQLAVKATEQTVTVTAEAGVVQADNPNLSTSMSSEQVHLVPNGGGDLSYIAQTAPGSSMNTGQGFGNFSSFGLPAIANTFTYNSMPENDPFLNLNNSGATNILLGQNDVSEATVVNNGYSGQYSGAGANVNYVSRAGTNAFHGNAVYSWNGRTMNANNYFNNQSTPAAPRGFVNDNQWATSVGGPIRKDKTFFFVDFEGLRVIVPVTRKVNVPSPQFEAATLANVPANERSFYQNMFNIYNNAPGASRAGTLPNGDSGCADFDGTAGFGTGGMPCALQFNSTVGDLTHEWLLTARVDHNIGPNDRMFVHVRTDQGLQATYTDPLNSAFNVTSKQPQWEGQFQEDHTFGTNTVNSLYVNGSYYRAIFVEPNLTQALQLQPMEVAFSGGAFRALGDLYSIFPQGRNVTQYGFVDDISHTMGSHSLKFGANLARYDITDYDPGIGSLPEAAGETVTNFFNGIASNFTQSFPARLTQPVNLYHLGFYGSDEWRVKKNLKLTLTLRADRNSDPSCNTNCFNRLVAPFNTVSHGLDVPYNQTIAANQSLAINPSTYHAWELEPRIGFNYSPGSKGNLVISGGFGVFSDVFPAGFVDNLMNNLPGDPTFTVSGLPFAPGVAGNAQGAAIAAANALRSGFANGATFGSLNSAVTATTGSPFSVPNFFNVGPDIHIPRFQEWDLQVQQAIGQKMALSLKYVGNHGVHEEFDNNGLNAYCGSAPAVTALPGTPSCFSALGITSFNGLPASPTDPRFLQITESSTGFTSNYNGLTVSLLRRLSAFQFQLNYTWSHALDFLSNNGQVAEPFLDTANNSSITNPLNPFNPRQNLYGNADYDLRHYVSANYVWDTPKGWMHGFLGGALEGWTVSGTVFWHTGSPYTIVDSGTGGTLLSYGYGGATNPNANQGINATFASNVTGVGPVSCNGRFADPANGACPALTNNFVSDPTGFGNQRRNQAFGPRFFDTDLTITKNFKLPFREGMTLGLGATAYNLFNHPNFEQPIGDVANSSFGTILGAVNPPTSIYGSFLGADASPRLVQLQAKFTF